MELSQRLNLKGLLNAEGSIKTIKHPVNFNLSPFVSLARFVRDYHPSLALCSPTITKSISHKAHGAHKDAGT